MKKKITKVIIAVSAILLCMAAYTIWGIHKNVQKMEAASGEEVTYFPDYPAVDTTGKNPEMVKRGEYLAKAGDCIACHTNTAEDVHGKPFAGGLAMPTPFGTIYSPNITPDKKTGIGNWTDEQFIKAMRDGISPSGHYYYPAFPYVYFSKLSDDDVKAIKAYLDSIPAVEQKNQENDMVWPFNIRFMQLGWRILFFNPNKAEPFQPDPNQSEQWNRGAYLVEGLGHCAMCHSPSYHIISPAISLGAPIQKYALTGAKIQGYLAPNITESNLSKISDEEIVEVFTQDKLIGGGKIEGPMLEANRDSFRYLSHEDLLGIATYLKSVQSQTPPKPSGKGLAKGIYENYCSGCHTSGGGGAPKFGDVADWEPFMKNGIDKVYGNAINGYEGMPAKGTCLSCSDDDIKQTVDYMVAAISGKSASKTSMAKPKPLTMADGQRIYNENCSACHNTNFQGAPKPGDDKAWEPIINQGFMQVYKNVVEGPRHPLHGACPTCTDAEIIAATKYMMTESSTSKNFSLW